MNNKYISIALAVSACATTAMAQTTYTWIGASTVDATDWADATNWDVNGVPVDDNLGRDGLSLPYLDKVVFAGATMPVNNPGIDSSYDSSNSGANSAPVLEFNSGGSISFAHTASHNNGMFTNVGDTIDRQMWTVGDGITGGTEDVVMNMTNGFLMMRHNNGIHRFTVNADGTLNVTGNVDFQYRTSRYGIMDINGGAVNITGSAVNLTGSNAYVEFTSVGGSFTAVYGGSFADIAAVEASIGATGGFRSVDSFTVGVQAVDNLDGTFTVSSVTPPAPNYWTGNGSSILGDATNNFTLNDAADPLSEGTLAGVIAIPATKVFFDDVYSFNGGTSPVNSSTLSTVAGGVMIDDLDFYNTIAYSLSSADANGVAGATNINLLGSGQLTLTGIHSTSGVTTVGTGNTLLLAATTDVVLPNGTIANAGTVIIDSDIAATQDGSLISGAAGTLVKQGTGDLTLMTGNPGALVVSEGEVSITDTYSNGAIDIASGATVDMTIAAFLNAPDTTFTGAGTLIKTGADQIRWAGQTLNMELDSGALIDVQAGIFRAGSNANDVWTSNLSDLNVAAGATFNTHEANVVVDALTGSGTVGSGFNGAGYANFTIGVDNGSGSFDGTIVDQDGNMPCNVVKLGTGTQTFNGDNTYKGDTTVEDGVLTLGFDNVMYFYPKGSGVSNSISGTAGTVNLGGIMVIDTSSAVAAPGSSWPIVDMSGGLTANFIPVDFLVQTATLDDWAQPTTGVWTYEEGIGTYTFTEATGNLTFDVAAGANLFTGLGGPVWDQATTANFSDNAPADPISNVTFDVATATSLNAIFADEYYNSGSPVTVTESTVTIAAGGVSIAGGSVVFANTSVPYIIESSDMNGIMGTTALDVSGPITLRGTHATTGVTTVGGGISLTLDAPVAASLVSSIAGGGDVVKTGVDTMTLSGVNTYTGSTTVSTGILEVTGNSGTTAVNIASGATFELNYSGRWGATATYSGAGTFLKTGTAGADFFGGTLALGSGSLISIQEGTLTGSSGGTGGSENWTANMSDMLVASGARFNGVEGNIRLNALDGLGTFSTGFVSAGYVSTTLGVDNGGGNFGGVIEDNNRALLHIGAITKVGTGTQTLAGYNTYTGNTSVEDGTLIIATGGALTFAPAGNGVINSVSGPALGTGTVTLEGDVNFNFVDVDTTPGNGWVIIDPTNITFSYGLGLFGVNSSDGAFTETTPGASGIWELDTNGNLWTYDEATYMLTVATGSPVVTEADITSGEFTSNFSFDGTNANFSFSVFDGSTYEIRRTSDLTLDVASWTTVYGPTAATIVSPIVAAVGP